jgi:hypothetical protein
LPDHAADGRRRSIAMCPNCVPERVKLPQRGVSRVVIDRRTWGA